MAKNGFMPAWMKISSSDKINDKQTNNKNEIIARQRHHSSDIVDRTTNQHTLFYYSKTNEQCRTKSNEQQSLNDFDEQSENIFSSFHSRRSFSREHLFGKSSELNDNEYSNHQRRLHSTSSSYNNRHHLINENSFERLSNTSHSDMTIKTNENNFDRHEKDFPSLNGRDLSSNHNDKSSVWNNAASKFRISNNGNHSRIYRSNRLLNSNLNSRSNISELQTNCITQTKNLDKRSDFLNSLKTNSMNEENKSNENIQITKETLVLLSIPETSEEKELLIRMGWNDGMNYEITDKDKEEYEKQIKFLPKTDNRSARLISALHRRSLPCINIRDVLQLEIIDSTSDDDDDDDNNSES